MTVWRQAIHSSSDQDYDSRDKKTQDHERVGYQQRAKMTGELKSSHICHVHMKLQAAAGWLRLEKNTTCCLHNRLVVAASH